MYNGFLKSTTLPMFLLHYPRSFTLFFNIHIYHKQQKRNFQSMKGICSFRRRKRDQNLNFHSTRHRDFEFLYSMCWTCHITEIRVTIRILGVSHDVKDHCWFLYGSGGSCKNPRISVTNVVLISFMIYGLRKFSILFSYD